MVPLLLGKAAAWVGGAVAFDYALDAAFDLYFRVTDTSGWNAPRLGEDTERLGFALFLVRNLSFYIQDPEEATLTYRLIREQMSPRSELYRELQRLQRAGVTL